MSDKTQRKHLLYVTPTSLIIGLFTCIHITSTTWGWPAPSSQLQSACPSVSSKWHFLNRSVKIIKCVDWINVLPHRYEPKTKRFVCDLTAINGSEGCQNKNIMPPCKQSERMLRQVFRLDNTQATFKMLVSWMAFRSIRAMLCWHISMTYQEVKLLRSLCSKTAPFSSCFGTGRCVSVKLWVSANGHDQWFLSSHISIVKAQTSG